LLAYAPAIFLGAFLLFQVQPLFGKFILPRFGGGPEVWTVCLLLFQVFLLAGYAYAHLSVRMLGFGGQAAVHLALLAAALAILPVTPSVTWRPDPAGNPTLQIFVLFTATVGLPYSVLAATSPLLQRWFSQTSDGAPPYRLYALSNAGSLLALVSYPFIVEPALSRGAQATVWSAGMAIFALFCAACAALVWRRPAASPSGRSEGGASAPLADRLLWLALPACASVELLAVTNKICQDVAAVPFLWVLPLGLYLLSFIICFDHARWYVRRLFLGLFVLSLVAVALAKAYADQITAAQQICVYSTALFACCMVCHGELYRLRPGREHVTGYYLMIAAGGAAGGLFVAVIAPLVFETYRELYLGFLGCFLCLVLADKGLSLGPGRRRWVYVGLLLAAGIAAIFMQDDAGSAGERAVLHRRNFFGVLTLWDNDSQDPTMHRHVLQHGTTFHGLQFTDPAKRLEPTAYYGRSSGVGLAMKCLDSPFRQADAGQGRRIGVVGLGVGTVAAYGRRDDLIRFYEINPAVIDLAETRFTYLADCKGNVEVVMGDARISLAGEPDGRFDLLVLDAFTSDAVPVHLLTKEAFEIYLRHVKADGIIAAHVSTVHLDLVPVIWKLAEHFGMHAAWIVGREDADNGIFASDWVLLAAEGRLLDGPAIRQAARRGPADLDRLDLWTDDHVNLLQVLR